MPTTKTARATTTAPIDGDALQFQCVTFSHLVRQEMNRIMDLRRTHRAPRKLTPNTAPRVAHLSFVRPKHPRPTHNAITLSTLPLCLHKHDFLGLLRPSSEPPPTAHHLPPKIGTGAPR
jgi:hypothetical protein